MYLGTIGHLCNAGISARGPMTPHQRAHSVSLTRSVGVRGSGGVVAQESTSAPAISKRDPENFSKRHPENSPENSGFLYLCGTQWPSLRTSGLPVADVLA